MELHNRWIDYDVPFVRRRYNRIAPFFVFFEWLFLLPPELRRKAVSRLELKPGANVFEVGCGTGRNLPPLVEAVGQQGHVYGVDLSEGMLTEARKLRARRGWSNVTLTRSDATSYNAPVAFDGAIFSLSYAVIPNHREALSCAWNQLCPGSYLVIMDAKLPSNFFGRLLHPFVIWASRLTVLGNPNIRPWDELKGLAGSVEMEEFSLGTYYICRARKPLLAA